MYELPSQKKGEFFLYINYAVTKPLDRYPSKVCGVLFCVTDGGPYSGIIDLFGGVGGLVEHRAALLASRGFAVMALQYIDVDADFKAQTDLSYRKVSIHHDNPAASLF